MEGRLILPIKARAAGDSRRSWPAPVVDAVYGAMKKE